MSNKNESTPARRVDDTRPAGKIDWDDPTRTAGAAKGGNTSNGGALVGYANASEVARLADHRVAGVAMMIHKDRSDNMVALYLAAPTVHSTTAAEIRAQALQEAAVLCETKGYVTSYGAAAGQSCAAAIRALAGQQVKGDGHA